MRLTQVRPSLVDEISIVMMPNSNTNKPRWKTKVNYSDGCNKGNINFIRDSIFETFCVLNEIFGFPVPMPDEKYYKRRKKC